jgi:hypothetical protein
LNVYKNLIILILLSVVIVFPLYEGVKRVTFKPFLLPQELELEGLSLEQVKIIRRESDIVSGLGSPLGGPSEPKKDFPAVPLPQALNQASSGRKKISLTLIKDGQRIAIINNHVVKEGEFAGKGKVLKIEIGRVLIRENGMDRWFDLDQEENKTLQENEEAGKASGSDRSKTRFGDETIEEIAKADKDRIPRQIEEIKKWSNVQ